MGFGNGTFLLCVTSRRRANGGGRRERRMMLSLFPLMYRFCSGREERRADLLEKLPVTVLHCKPPTHPKKTLSLSSFSRSQSEAGGRPAGGATEAGGAVTVCVCAAELPANCPTLRYITDR